MDARVLQSIISENRQRLASLYNIKAEVKADKAFYDKHNDIGAEYECHNFLKDISKTIEKYATIQIALKRELGGKVKLERAIRYINQLCEAA